IGPSGDSQERPPPAEARSALLSNTVGPLSSGWTKLPASTNALPKILSSSGRPKGKRCSRVPVYNRLPPRASPVEVSRGPTPANLKPRNVAPPRKKRSNSRTPSPRPKMYPAHPATFSTHLGENG